MGTISYAQVPPTAATIALNAYIYGFGGHSLVTPHAALKQLWWTEDRIDSKVTRKFVVSQIKGEERDFLDKPLAFGEGLTDDTYMEWILGRARRLFLIMAEIGKPEQIFGLIDDSLDDDDLPFSLESIVDMDLCVEPDERLNRKFYATQFLYLLRQLGQGGHIDYGPQEHIPMEYVHKVPPAVSLQSWDRVHFPKDHEQVYARRKFAFGTGDDKDELREAYLRDTGEAGRLVHPHIARVWASYTAGDAGYVLSDFVAEHTLASFIAHRTPYQFMRVPQGDRPIILLEWMHCLVDALAMLHHQGLQHGAIRPSNILVDHDNCIAFSDIGILRTFQRGKKAVKNEVSGYSAPEIYQEEKVRGVHFADAPSSPVEIKRGSNDGTISGVSISSSSPSDTSKPVLVYSSSPPVDSPMNSFNPSSPAPIPLFRNFSRHLPPPPTFASANSSTDDGPKFFCPDDVGLSQPSPIRVDRRPSWASWGTTPCPTSSTASDPSTLLSELLNEPLSIPKPLCIRKTTSQRSLNSNIQRNTQADTGFESDVFCLGCVYLDLVTYIVKGKLSDLQKFRAQSKAPLPTDTATLYTWLAHLASDAIRLSPTVPVLSALVPILGVVRDMLLPDPSHRPTALVIRDRIAAALEQADLHSLCCKERSWDPELAVLQRARLSTRRPPKTSEDKSTRPSLGSETTEGSAEVGAEPVADSHSIIMRRSLSVGSGVMEKNGNSRMKKLGLGWMRKPHAKGF
ncbi:kinase-like protein [Aureobasidium subglaciale]|nr:kinase-like protein [Aureobasidium subglaciale]KAI5223728.1 kinase-like protein [Aureobasidium subglaciale]KAI5227140.1 kinase-like protein [Aureobasidium subglaciale]KAI5262529.1 kinase-like protein [Aureobasidium subglaciale]